MLQESRTALEKFVVNRATEDAFNADPEDRDVHVVLSARFFRTANSDLLGVAIESYVDSEEFTPDEYSNATHLNQFTLGTHDDPDGKRNMNGPKTASAERIYNLASAILDERIDSLDYQLLQRLVGKRFYAKWARLSR